MANSCVLAADEGPAAYLFFLNRRKIEEGPGTAMAIKKASSQIDDSVLLSPSDFFLEAVDTACVERQFMTFPMARTYLVRLLEYYVPAGNLYEETDDQGRRRDSMLGETFLKALNAETLQRSEMLKRLADRALYVSGFFSDSLQRKLVDVDYYAEIGVSAYSVLADSSKEDTTSRVYREFAERFVGFSEILSTISSRARMQDEANILRLYETYAKTGSDLAREKLLERGLIAIPLGDLKKPTKQ